MSSDLSVRGWQIAMALVNAERVYSPKDTAELIGRGIQQAHQVKVEPSDVIAAMGINMNRGAYRSNEVKTLIQNAIVKSVPTCPHCSQPWQRGEIFHDP